MSTATQTYQLGTRALSPSKIKISLNKSQRRIFYFMVLGNQIVQILENCSTLVSNYHFNSNFSDLSTVSALLQLWKVSEFFCCHISNRFFKWSATLQIHQAKGEDFVWKVYPKTMILRRWTLFDRMTTFDFEVTKDTIQFNIFAVFDCEPNCGKNSKATARETTTRVGKLDPTSVSLSTNPWQKSVFVCETRTHWLASALVHYVENLADEKRFDIGIAIQEFATTSNEEVRTVRSSISTRGKQSSCAFNC